MGFSRLLVQLKMKLFLLILTLGFIGCSFNGENEIHINETVVFDEQSNWSVNLDSLVVIDNYILTYRDLRRNGTNSVKPYIHTSRGTKISLREIRPPKGNGYFWDCRAHMRIFLNPDGSYFCSWNSGESCTTGQIINNEKTIYDSIELQDEIFRFYSTNSLLELETELNDNDLEIWITPFNDSLSPCKSVIETVAIVYQKFHLSKLGDNIPLSIVLSPSQDNNRMKRILKKEKTKAHNRVYGSAPK